MSAPNNGMFKAHHLKYYIYYRPVCAHIKYGASQTLLSSCLSGQRFWSSALVVVEIREDMPKSNFPIAWITQKGILVKADDIATASLSTIW